MMLVPGTDVRKTRPLRILAVGDGEKTGAAGAGLQASRTVTIIRFGELDHDLLKRVGPNIVLSRLFNRGFDCLELAERLCALGFQGLYYAIADSIPNPTLVEREVARSCPGLSFVVIPETGVPHSLMN